ncbi:class I SAM-dependent methyltransferase [Acidithiobacillus thiooxidans]|uniref:class I SAM-dependent methyltransferase n=1 Tax=Acidithiobacillus thiooxidans TaxID=930 RepID=UPI001C0796AD|nr:class I SAM-dependent methyltransferase [Acidithiobacillus thiooxidans]MBU2838316.1 class I SAM-dependent methyltransferase [Acidithiobacillus thiooxidans]
MFTKCQICISKYATLFGSYEWTSENKTYNLYKCKKCGSAFTCPLPTDAMLQELYKHSFSYEWYRNHLSAKIKDSETRYNAYKNIIGNMVLDYGGGIGYFSQVCRDHGLNSITYDPYTTDNAQTNKWDTVVALHVIEHSNNPDNIIDNIKSLLVNNGTLILAVPNFSGIGYHKMGMQWVWAQPPFLHIFHFTAEGISRLLERHGFTIIEISYHDRWDANIYCDVINAAKYAKRDAMWSNKILGKYYPYRMLISQMNSYARFNGLKKSNKLIYEDTERSELQVIAKYKK